MASTSGFVALIAGATGLVGSALLKRLLQQPQYAAVHAVVRRPFALPDAKLKVHVLDFERITDAPIERVDHAFCCLGTTLKQAQGRAGFRRVDFDYVLGFAKLAQAAGASRFLGISAMGADPHSRIFYNRVKGEVEQALGQLNLPSAIFFRPSLLLGHRREKRPGEQLGALLTRPIRPLLRGSLARYRPIEASRVAEAMLQTALAPEISPGVTVLESDEIQKVALRHEP